jgi:hypothetical protein
MADKAAKKKIITKQIHPIVKRREIIGHSGFPFSFSER